MRITKEPEERKQEILDTAMRLFHEKGYEKTSITDIAKTIGVAQGLCYRYFPSKEALFDSAIEQYADELVSRFSVPSSHDKMTLKELIETMPIMVETEDSSYYKTLHVVENKKFHDQLMLKVCEKLSRVVAKLLEHAKEKGEISIGDTRAAALFCVYGQIGILLNKEYTAEEKEKHIRNFLIYALRL
ncbi:MAG: TetR/AcrR family transcriptional regulator [Lachnospiraceae bacterium]|nr:TetR/AcrR family transcriptional regulator [Lachnospiraceae bacterium]